MNQFSDFKFMDRPPLPFVIAKGMMRHKIRGGRRLFAALDRLGYLSKKIVKYELRKNYSVFVPAYRPEHWDLVDILQYERSLIVTIASEAMKCTGPLTIVDCGADIGLISVALSAELNRVSNIVAFEPSDEAFPVLKKTLAELPFETKAIKAGVSDFIGRGELRSPSYDASHHARYLMQIPQGGFPVTTVDAMSLNATNLILKIDVEGGELGVIRGARRALAEAKKAIVSVEAHPNVVGRTEIDPVVILREIAAIRPFAFTVAETGRSDLNLSDLFFNQQVNDGTIYNIVCSSR